MGLYEADKEQLRPAYTSELPGLGVRYIIEESYDDPFRNPYRLRRLVLLPLSLAEITRQELTPLSQSDTKLPCALCCRVCDFLAYCSWRGAEVGPARINLVTYSVRMRMDFLI